MSKQLVTWVLLFGISIIVNFFCNTFSPIYIPQLEPDQMMFYMAGKAWMNGMIPYVDFSDVKGPLLFLVYGIAYVITPDGSGGVYFLFSCLTATTLWYVYRTGRMLGLESSMALLACGFSLIALFNANTIGGRAEDLLHPFIAALLYYFVAYLRGKQDAVEAQLNSLRMVGWASGICIASAFLIKFNNMAIGGMAAVLILYCEYKRKSIKLYFTAFLPRLIGGFALLSIPFTIILFYYGAFDDFLKVYIGVNTESSNYLFPSLSRTIFFIITNTLQHSRGLYVLTGASLLIPNLFPGTTKDTTERLLLFILFFSSFSINCIFPSGYYMIACAPFYSLLSIAVAKRIQAISYRKVCYLLPGIIMFVIAYNGTWITRCSGKVLQRMTGEMQELEKELQSITKPKVIYYHYLDYGFGMKAGALPGCPYWTRLNGLKERCNSNQRLAITNGKPDFIIYTHEKPTDEEHDFFTKHGYKFVKYYNIHAHSRLDVYLYKKSSTPLT